MHDFIKRLREDRKHGRRTLRHGDPSIGLEYNGIVHTHRVSRNTYSVDIARTPQVIKDLGSPRIDVQGESWKANRYNIMINYAAYKCNGAGRW